MNIKPLDTIETSQGEATVFAGRDAVEVFRIAALISAVKLEGHGIKIRRGFSALKAAKQTTGLKTNDRALHILRLEMMLANAKSRVAYVEREA